MHLTVKLVGPLSRYLPENSDGGEVQIEVGDSTTVTDLMKVLGIPEDKKCMISINDDLLPIEERRTRTLCATDSIKFIPPLKGG